MEKRMVKIIVSNIKGKALAERENKIYIIPAEGYYRNQEIMINLDLAIQVPSLLHGIATLYNDDFEEAVKFIKENW
ncbi:MAG: hypothetical protein K9L74_06515 [Candidatus Izimaplasma sp.]|nr:hypothetical protein [Candidatus Izimaplasma bacterium]